MSQSARIEDVARAAGVSITTVSHALNGKGRVKESTRINILEVAARFRYRADPIARRLAGGTARMLVLTVSKPPGSHSRFMDYEYFHLLIDGAAEEALAREYWPVIAPSGGSVLIREIPLDGALIVDPMLGDPLLLELQSRGVPIVTTGRPPDEGEAGYWVDNDHYDGTQRVLTHLHKAGASRIALINGPPIHSYSIDTASAYRAWCAAHGMVPQIVTAGTELDENAGCALAKKLLTSAHPPDAIHAVLDQLAIGVLLAARDLGLEVPRQLMVSGTTDTSRSRSGRPPLTVLDLHPRTLGAEAIKVLAEVIEGSPVQSRHRTVKTTLVTRASTARVSNRHPRAAAKAGSA